MLELIYHTSPFGPIHLTYNGPAIRVGRSEDNDLVVRHPSVESYHCLLVFRNEKVICLPPDHALPSESELADLAGQEFSAGDHIQIGELQFSLEHSARTVAIPLLHAQEPGNGTAGAIGGKGQRRFFCPRCRVFILPKDVKHLGLVGRAKRDLCPRCSSLLVLEPEPPRPLSGIKKWLRRAMLKLTGSASAER